MEMKKKISVIVPVYNAEKTIERCLLSILAQTYSNLEVIVVNDGSKDSTERIVSDMAKKDSRICLFSIENGGVSHARNYGLDQVSGEYVSFVDADDYLDQEMYYSLIELSLEHGVKIAHCSYQNNDENGNVLSVVGGNGKVVKQNHDEAISCLINGILFTGGLWNKLYAVELFEHCRFDEVIRFNEDVLMNMYLFDQVEQSVYSDMPLYHYVASQDSATHSANSIEYCKQRIYVSRKILEISRGKAYERSAEDTLLFALLGLYREYLFDDRKKHQHEKKQIEKEVDDYRKKGLLSARKDRIQYFLYRHFPLGFIMIYSLYSKVRKNKLDPEQ